MRLVRLRAKPWRVGRVVAGPRNGPGMTEEPVLHPMGGLVLSVRFEHGTFSVPVDDLEELPPEHYDVQGPHAAGDELPRKFEEAQPLG